VLDCRGVDDEAYGRYVRINLPHARTLIERIRSSLEALGAFGEGRNGGAALGDALQALAREANPYDEDPPAEQALQAADRIAEHGRRLVAAIVATPTRSDRLGQLVRNLFECLGLRDEGAELSLKCGERPDSPLR
jgi:hypothetical protein